MTRRIALIAAAVLLAIPVSGMAQARLFGGAVTPVAAAPRQGQVIPLEKIVEMIRKRTPGRLLDAGIEGVNYRIRWAAANGRRIDYLVDAATGQILSAEGE